MEHTRTQGDMGRAKNTFAIYLIIISVLKSKHFICSYLGLIMAMRVREICSNFTDDNIEAWKVWIIKLRKTWTWTWCFAYKSCLVSISLYLPEFMKTWKAPYRREVSKPESMTIILKCKEEKTLSPVGAGLDKPALGSGRFPLKYVLYFL